MAASPPGERVSESRPREAAGGRVTREARAWVRARCGRRVIETGNGRSPLTREKLEPSLVPNRALLRRMRVHQEETVKVAQLAAAQARRLEATAASPSGEASGAASGAASLATDGADDGARKRGRADEEREASTESSSRKRPHCGGLDADRP